MLAGGDTLVERNAHARLTYLGVMRATDLRQVDSVIAQQDSATRKTAYAARVAEQLLLVRLFAQQDEPTGAALFLAGEVARDSLRAQALARGFFLRIARDMPTVPLAPAAWHAAAALTPDSLDVWHARIRRDYPSSFVTAWISGRDPAQQSDFGMMPQLLDLRWTQALRVWSDSVRKLRAPASPSTLPSRKG